MEGTLGSKATGEPSMLMGCSVAFALRDAIRAAREELGLPGDDGIPGWVNLCKQCCVQKFCLLKLSYLSGCPYHVDRTDRTIMVK